MGSNRFSKPTPPPVDYRPKKTVEEEVKLDFKPCLTCGKTITTGFYGRWEEGGTCSKKCEIMYQSKPKLHGGREIIDGKEWL